MILILCLFVCFLILSVTTPSEKVILEKAATQIVVILSSNTRVWWDKLNGIEPFYIDGGQDVFDDKHKAPKDKNKPHDIFETVKE